MLKVTFPDGAQKEYDKGITPLEIAQSISHSLAKRLLSASPWGGGNSLTSTTLRHETRAAQLAPHHG